MVLDSNTGLKVLGLFNTKGFNSVSYCGSWGSDSISFEVTRKDHDEIKAGFVVTIDEDFNIKNVRRITKLVARNIYGGPKNKGFKKVYDRFNFPIC